ncbi:MAG: hypothetical protein ACPG4U_09845 [Pseudomonadales bacterium]
MIKIGLFLLVAPCLLLMGFYLPEQTAISDCLAAGGSFNYSAQACDMQQGSHPFLPFMARHAVLVNSAMLIAVVGLFMCIIGLYRPNRNPQS